MTNAPTTPTSDFLAAEVIKGILRDRERPEQERILRWVSESLGIGLSHTKSRGEHGHVPAPQSASAGPAAQREHSDERSNSTDIRSFVQEKLPSSDVHFAAVVAFFHRFVASPEVRKDQITSEDLQTAARQAQRSVFKTPSVPWKLLAMVEVAHELTWITKSAKDVGNVLRDFRNYIHPHKEHTDGVVIGSDDARIFWEVSKAISRQVLASVCG